MALFPVIFEDSELLVVHKPAGLVCHPTKGDEYSSLVGRGRLYLGAQSNPHLVHRLDRETSGVMVLGKTSKAALELRKLWELGFVSKEYCALVHGAVEEDCGIIDLRLGPDEQSEIAIKDCVRPDGAPARTRWWRERVLEQPEGVFSQLRVRLDTGRKHQIRVHLAAVGHPIVGDKLYGSNESFYLDFVHRRLTDSQRRQLLLPHQALHAERLWFPWGGREVEFRSPPEPWFQEFAAGLPVTWGPDAFDPARPGQ